MQIIELKEVQNISNNKSLDYTYSRFKELLQELRNKELSQKVIACISRDIKEINSSANTDKILSKLLNDKHTKILTLVKKEYKLIPKGPYTNLWAVLGIIVFELPFGIIYGKITDNVGIIGAGLPVGLGVGILVGMWFDNKVKKEGRQLNIRA
jgi:hypothetical protein